MTGKQHMMVDIETLGRGANASILSIGACMFDDTGIGAEFEVNLKHDGRSIDPETVRWWLQQSKAAQEKLFTPEPVTVKYARQQFQRFCEEHKPKYVWANGANFDLLILRDLYGGYPPWTYRAEMCMRSIRTLGHTLGIDYSDWWHDNNHGVQHGALDDAIRQAKYVNAVFAKAKNNE